MIFAAWLPALLGFLSAVGPVSTDMYLPAFPAIASALHGQPQLTLATWFAGLAIGQLTQGPLSDRFGRRAPLLFGTGIYTLASVGCALAPDLPTLSIFRLIAAFGGSASMVIPRAVIRDLANGQAAAQLMSRLMLVMGVAPILAPTLGSAVLDHLGWQAIFWFCAFYGAVAGLLVWWKLPDTLAPERRVSLAPYAQIKRYRAIIVERGFLSHALIGGCAMFGMFAFLGGSPAVFEGLFHLTPGQYGALFGTSAAGFIVASQLNPILLPRLGPDRLIRYAVRVFLVATLALAVIAFTAPTSWIAVAIPIFVAMATQGFTMPNATVGALSRHALHAGSASALLGTLQFCLGATSGLAVGLLEDGTARPMALLLLLGAVGATLAERARPRPVSARSARAPAAIRPALR